MQRSSFLAATDRAAGTRRSGDRAEPGELHRPPQAGAHDIEQEILLLGLFCLEIIIDSTVGIFVDDRAPGQEQKCEGAARSGKAPTPTQHLQPQRSKRPPQRYIKSNRTLVAQ